MGMERFESKFPSEKEPVDRREEVEEGAKLKKLGELEEKKEELEERIEKLEEFTKEELENPVTRKSRSDAKFDICEELAEIVSEIEEEKKK